MLRLLFDPPVADDGPNGLDIVVIPAWGFSQPSQWANSSPSPWLKKLSEDLGPSATVFEYILHEEYGNSLSDHVLNGGKDFLKSLRSHRPNHKVSQGRTGGFVLKKALCLCRLLFHECEYLIQTFSGLIFLGAPHFQRDATVAEAKQTIEFLLKYRDQEAKRNYQAPNDAQALISLCQEFERLNINIPAISVFESQTAAYQSGFFARFLSGSQAQIVVPQKLSQTGIAGEQLVDSLSSHARVCDIDVTDNVYRKIQGLLSDIMETAPERIARMNVPYKVPLLLQHATLRSDAGSLEIGHQLPGTAPIPMSDPEGGSTAGSTDAAFELVPLVNPLEGSEKTPILPCFMLGSQRRAEPFMGRDDILATIDEYLLPEQGAPDDNQQENIRSFAICGLGGVGKTSLAVEYAFSRKDIFDAVFWLNADNANILGNSFAHISTELGLEDTSSDIAASHSIVMNWLSKPLKRPSESESQENLAKWLIIFDNVDNLDVLSEFWPGLGRGSVLVTSRDPQAKLNMHIRDGIQLPCLSLENSRLLLEQLTMSPTTQAQENAIQSTAGRLGGLPLAINQMAGIYRQLRCSHIDVVRLLDERGIATTFQVAANLNDGQESRSLATIWAPDQLEGPTRALLQVICLLDPDAIPEELLISCSVTQHLPDYPDTRLEYLKARGELLSSSLINLHEESGDISIHRLIQDSVLHDMSREQLEATYQAAIALAIDIWPFQPIKEHHSIERFSKCETFFPSVLRLKDGLELSIREGSFPLTNLEAARLFNDVGWYMFERGLPDKTVPFCNVALMIGEQMKGNRPSEAHKIIRESHSFIGIALVETNSHDESEKHKKRWLDMLLDRKSESGLQIRDYELGYAYNEIGVAYGNIDLYEKACEAFRESIEIFQGLEDYKDTMLGWPEPNLGFMYWLLKDYHNSEKVLIEILDIHAAEWGVDDTKSFKTGKILYGLGNVLTGSEDGKDSGSFFVKFKLRPTEYADAVKDFSKLQIGSNYLPLGEFLTRERESTTVQIESAIEPGSSTNAALVYSLPLCTENQDDRRAETSSVIIRDPKQLYEFELESETSCLIFLRGFLSAAWINNIGSRFFVDPEFFGRHLDFRSTQDKLNNFSTPCLPSASWHLMELPMTIIGSRESALHGMSPSAWIEKEREKSRYALERHHEKLSSLRSDIGPGESMVRDYYVFDEVHFAIDQRISICMQQAEDGKSEDERRLFRILVWADAGSTTCHDKHGPWDTEPFVKYHPVIENKPMIALKSHLFQSGANEKGSLTPQDSVSQLYRNYGRSLRPDIQATDPFYALGEVFQFSANSQQQFLNMIDAKLRIYSAKGPEDDYEILPHLKYTQQLLYSRISDIKRVLMSIENTLHPAWAKSKIREDKAKRAYDTIQRDFKHLLDHAVSLYDRTKEAISVLQSSISIAESHSAILQADKAGKLTFLASAFVPVSVATGIFGMNVKELPGDQISILWFFVVAVILTTLIFILFYFDGFWRKLWRGGIPRARYNVHDYAGVYSTNAPEDMPLEHRN
ncbi:hypothetical protein MKX08_007652 [Trichoderma sp. CBMAI-0020]|nr:hypothetical protein MKX08_007652 [Trichoderma sp. CBMAI-0020]